MYLSDYSKNLISAEEKVAELIKQRDQLRAECNNLNNLLRAVGWGQGEIDSAACIEEENEKLRAEVERLGHLEAVLRSSAADMTAGSITAGGVADLRAENERLRRAYVRPDDIRAQLESATARAERAEAELAFQVARNSDLFTQRDEAVEAQGKAEAELATERKAKRDLAQAELATERTRLRKAARAAAWAAARDAAFAMKEETK